MGQRVILVRFVLPDSSWCRLSWTENVPRDGIHGNPNFSEISGFSQIREAPRSLLFASIILNCLQLQITHVPKCPVLEVTFLSPSCSSESILTVCLGAVLNGEITNPKHKSGNNTTLDRPREGRWFAI